MCYSIEIDKKIKDLKLKYHANMSEKSFEKLEFELEKLDKTEVGVRIYKNKYVPALIWRKEQREIVPLRFNLLPSFSETEKYQFFNPQKGKTEELSTYNARIETIEKTKAYKNLIGRHHCVIPAKSFYEWVPREGKKVEVNFSFEGEDILLAGVWDHWGKQNEQGINSFAIITTPPREEVAKFGHQRSPLILTNDQVEDWLKARVDYKTIASQANEKVLTGLYLEKN